MVEQVDVVVLGMGPGGEEVAGRLAEAGLSVVGIEEKLLGGECPYWGCVPSKMMIRAAHLLAEARRVPGMAGEVTVRPDWAPVAQRIRDEATDDWNDQVAVDRFVGKGGSFIRGRGRLTRAAEVTVDGRVYRAARGVVIATGTSPSVPPIDGLRDTSFWTNREAVETKEVPGSLLVIGGGAVGLELAQVFARFGAQVTVLEAADRLLPPEEPEAGALLDEMLRGEGLVVRTGVRIESVRHRGGEFSVALDGGDPLRAEQLLVATGRRTDLAAVGVGAVGLDESARFLPTDDRLRVTDRLWAVGDVTGKGAFTHVAIYQAAIVVADILGQPHAPADYRALPRVTFTDPEVGAVGLTESQARDAGLRVRTSVSQVPSSARGWIHKAGNDGFVKLVADRDRGILVGATSAGPAGGEVLGALAVAVHAEVPVQRLATMMYAYPTFHRAIEDAVKRLG